MIYTIGYQATDFKHVCGVMDELSIGLLIDVRTHPYSRNPTKRDFNRNRLIEALGPRYKWLGDICGGLKGPALPECIDEITRLGQEGNILLMCMEDHPCDCHRYLDIGLRLLGRGIEAVHLVGDVRYTTGELGKLCKERSGRAENL